LILKLQCIPLQNNKKREDIAKGKSGNPSV
jgi:hypothetical protein